jgi:pyroglutamyl-peptidase
MRFLIYGFGPYRRFRENVTERILRRLPQRRGLKKVVFPVKFSKSQFVEAVKRNKPDLILGLGQCSRGRRLRIESRAVNRRRNNKRDKAKPIVSGGSRRLLTNLNLKRGRQAKFSTDAGDYVCNYSMYVILDFLTRRPGAFRFGFIHVPHGYDAEKAARFLAATIAKMKPTR